MIKSFIKYIGILVIFVASLLVFLPKENLYFLLLDKIKQEKVIVKNTKIQDDYYSFKLTNTDILYQGVKAVNIENLNIQTYLVSSKIEVSNIVLDDIAKQFLPSRIKTIQISHSVLDPLAVHIKANLIQAKAYGVFNLTTQTVVLNIIPSKQFIKSYKRLLKNMKKMKNGEYQIEYKL